MSRKFPFLWPSEAYAIDGFRGTFLLGLTHGALLGVAYAILRSVLS